MALSGCSLAIWRDWKAWMNADAHLSASIHQRCITVILLSLGALTRINPLKNQIPVTLNMTLSAPLSALLLIRVNKSSYSLKNIFSLVWKMHCFLKWFSDHVFMTFWRIHIEPRLCVKLCPPALLGLHMMSLCLSSSAFLFTSSVSFCLSFCFCQSIAFFFSLSFLFFSRCKV